MAEPAGCARRLEDGEKGGGPPPGGDASARPLLACRDLGVTAGGRPLLRSIDLEILPGEVLAVVGRSGAGKSTFLKCLNRLVELEPGLAVTGDVLFQGESIYRRGVDADALRARIGTLFQQPVVFPRSIFANVIFGVRHLRLLPRRLWAERVESALERVHLWSEVRERLDRPASELSVGQQQRLCLARTLALEPEVILMDEPTSALDSTATAAIQALITELSGRNTIVLVTHDIPQARRVADRVACLCVRDGAGEIDEVASDPATFREPECRDAVSWLLEKKADSTA